MFSSAVAFAIPRGQRMIFGAGRGPIFYTAPELTTFNARLGNSPRLTVDHEFGRILSNQATFELTQRSDVWTWGGELQNWSESHIGTSADGGSTPRSAASLSFIRAWMTGGVRLWPWVGPRFVRRQTSLVGFGVVGSKPRPLDSGFFSWLRVATGPLFWKHSYQLLDEENQTSISYASQTVSWEGAVRWSVGWRLGPVCDLGVDLIGSTSKAFHKVAKVGQYTLSGRESLDVASELEVDKLAATPWRSTQILLFLRFFYP
jgi:hypothetical protein